MDVKSSLHSPLTAVAIGTGKYIEYLADDDKKSKNK